VTTEGGEEKGGEGKRGARARYGGYGGYPFTPSEQYGNFSDFEGEFQSRRDHVIASVKSIDSVEQGRSSNKMSDNDHGGSESPSSKVRFHTRKSKGSYASSSRSGGKSNVYEEEGDSERSRHGGPQSGEKCEREL
jgi:hypothetical protein